MGVWIAAVWGLTGGVCVEALELYAHIRRTPGWDWRRPIDQGMAAFVVAVALRVGTGAVIATVFAGGHQVSGPLAAFALGAATPVVVTRLARAVPLTGEAIPLALRRRGNVRQERDIATRPQNILQAGDVTRRGGPMARHAAGSGRDAG